MLATAIGTATDLSTAVQLSAALLFVALVAFAGAAALRALGRAVRGDVQPDALILYMRMAVFIVPLVPVLVFVVAAVAPWAGLALLIGLNLLGLLPLESRQPPAGIGYLIVLISVVPVGAIGCWLVADRARRRRAAGATPVAATPAD